MERGERGGDRKVDGRSGGDRTDDKNQEKEAETVPQAHGQGPAEVLFSATMADRDRQGVLHEMTLTITTDHLPHLPHLPSPSPSPSSSEGLSDNGMTQGGLSDNGMVQGGSPGGDNSSTSGIR